MVERSLSELKKGTIVKEKSSKRTGYRILDDEKNELAFGAGNPLKYGFEFIIYESDSIKNEIFKITQEDVLEGKYKFKLTEGKDGNLIGHIKRKKRSSFSKDIWTINNRDGEEIAKLEEDSKYKAIIRDYIIGTLPRIYHIYLDNNNDFGKINQKFSINGSKFNFELHKKSVLDSRFILAIIFCIDNL